MSFATKIVIKWNVHLTNSSLSPPSLLVHLCFTIKPTADLKIKQIYNWQNEWLIHGWKYWDWVVQEGMIYTMWLAALATRKKQDDFAV